MTFPKHQILNRIYWLMLLYAMGGIPIIKAQTTEVVNSMDLEKKLRIDQVLRDNRCENLLIVGQNLSKKREVITASSGRAAKSPDFYNILPPGFSAITCIRQHDDGTILLGGSVKRGRSEESMIVRIKSEEKKLSLLDTLVEGRQGVIKDIVSLSSNDVLVITSNPARRIKNSEFSLYLLQLDRYRPQDFSFLRKFPGKFSAIVKESEKSVVIFGTSSEEEKLFAKKIELTSNKRDVQVTQEASPQLQEGKYGISAVIKNLNGGYTLTGKHNRYLSSTSDIFYLELDPDLNVQKDIIFDAIDGAELSGNDCGYSIIQNAAKQYLIGASIKNTERYTPMPMVILLDEDGQIMSTKKFMDEDGKDIFISENDQVHLVQQMKRQVSIIFSNAEKKQFYKYSFLSSFLPPPLDSINLNKIDFDISFSVESKNGELELQKLGIISLNLMNNTNYNLADIEININDPFKDLTFIYGNNLSIPVLPINKSNSFNFLLEAKNIIRKHSVNLEITLSLDQEAIIQKMITIQIKNLIENNDSIKNILPEGLIRVPKGDWNIISTPANIKINGEKQFLAFFNKDTKITKASWLINGRKISDQIKSKTINRDSSIIELENSVMFEHRFWGEIPKSVFREGKNEIELEITRLGGKVDTSDTVIISINNLGTLFLVSIGVNYTSNPNPDWNNLKYTGKDALDIVELFRPMVGDERPFDTIIIESLVSVEKTSQDYLEDFFRDIDVNGAIKGRKINPDRDVIIVFVSGHGVNKDEKLHLVTSDKPKAHFRVAEDMIERVTGSKDKPYTVLFIFDVCHSAAAYGEGGKWKNKGKSHNFEEIYKSSGTTIIASSKDDQLSCELQKKGENGALVHAMKEAANNECIPFQGGTLNSDSPDQTGLCDGIITLIELMQYLKIRVPVLAEECKKDGTATNQDPMYFINEKTFSNTFPIFIVPY